MALDGQLEDLIAMRLRLCELAPEVAAWYEQPRAMRAGPRPAIPRQHVAEVEELLGHLLR